MIPPMTGYWPFTARPEEAKMHDPDWPEKAMSDGQQRATTPEDEKSAPEKHAQEPMLQFFAYGHLPHALVHVSKPFGELACALVEALPRNPERTAALRKLLEAKDCAVRALIYKG